MARKKARVKSKTTSSTLPPHFITTFGKKVLLRANKKTRALAQEIVTDAKVAIRTQKYNWAPLSDRYLERKQRLGLDERIYMATREYVNKGIGVFEKDGYVFAGPKRGTHKPSGLEYRVLARILEFGTDTIPARPLWRLLLSNALRKSEYLRKSLRSDTAKRWRTSMKRSKKRRARRSK